MTKKTIATRIASIEARNQRVEEDKAWETSWTRKISIAVLTYLVVAAYLGFVIRINPWLNAIVPTAGFLLSTLTLGYIKTYWISKRN